MTTTDDPKTSKSDWEIIHKYFPEPWTDWDGVWTVHRIRIAQLLRKEG